MGPLEMLPIAIADFITALAMPVDIYIRLGEDKFVMVCKAGAKTSIEQLSSYHNKDVHYVWVKKTDYYKLSNQSITIAGLAVKRGDIEQKQKTRVLSAATKTIFHQFDHIGISISMYNDARSVTEATVTMLESHRDLGPFFDALQECSDEILRHSMAVSILATMLGVSLGWEKKLTLEKLALGGLLHDIGLKTIPPELLSKPKSQMTFEETQIYETHSFRGMQLLLSLGIVPDDIVSIVYEHHENALSQGYPQRIRDVKIHPLARVVGLADFFVDLTIANVNCPTPKNPREALLYIEHTMGLPYNREVFRALKRIVEGDIKKNAS